MSKGVLKQIFGMFFLNVLIVAAIEVFFYKIGVWEYDKPWLAISIKSLSLALAVTLIFKWSEIRSLFKNDSHEGDQL